MMVVDWFKSTRDNYNKNITPPSQDPTQDNITTYILAYPLKLSKTIFLSITG